jgi:hypothetical protein
MIALSRFLAPDYQRAIIAVSNTNEPATDMTASAAVMR